MSTNRDNSVILFNYFLIVHIDNYKNNEIACI